MIQDSVFSSRIVFFKNHPSELRHPIKPGTRQQSQTAR